MKTGIPTNGSMVKNHISLRRDSDYLQHRELCSYRGSRLVKFFLWIFINFKDTYETGESFFIIFFILTFFTSVQTVEGQVRTMLLALESRLDAKIPVTEIARSTSGPKLQELRAEDAKSKPYLVLTTSVT